LHSTEPVNLHLTTGFDLKIGGHDGPHGPVWYAGAITKTRPERFFYLAETQSMVLVWKVTVNCGVQITMFAWKNDQLVEAATVTRNAVADTEYEDTIKAPYGGYFCFTVEKDVEAPSPFIISELYLQAQDEVSSTFSHRPLPDYATIMPQVQECRLVGTAGMISNTAAEAWKNGTVYAVQLQGTQSWQDFMFDATEKITDTNNFFTDNARNGVYAFLKPVEANDFKFIKEFEMENGNVVDSFWDIQFKRDHLLLYLSAADVQGRGVDISHGACFEFKSTSKATALGETRMTEADHSKAMNELRTMRQFSSNDNHIATMAKSVFNTARKAYNFYKEYKDEIGYIAKAGLALLA
jgi:hypothetical protein